MPHISLEDYTEYIKEQRVSFFPTPFEFVYHYFMENYANKDRQFFFSNASNFIDDMRKICWREYQALEKRFTSNMLEYLIDKDTIEQMASVEAVKSFVQEYPEHIYSLSLSNTQSRRSRAGKEFEAILQLMLIGCDIYTDVQGSVGKKLYQESRLGKLVDFITPGVIEYIINKNKTVLISAKTTLRERWQEVPEEVSRTGISQMLLATLDGSISDESLQIMYESNIIITTTQKNKDDNYPHNTRIITFEEMLVLAKETMERWNAGSYSESNKQKLKAFIIDQIEKYNQFPYVCDYYNRRLASL